MTMKSKALAAGLVALLGCSPAEMKPTPTDFVTVTYHSASECEGSTLKLKIAAYDGDVGQYVAVCRDTDVLQNHVDPNYGQFMFTRTPPTEYANPVEAERMDARVQELYDRLVEQREIHR